MRIALQMDPVEAINPDSDSTFLLGLGAQELGHTLFYYQPKDLRWLEGKLTANAVPIIFYRDDERAGDKHFIAGAPQRMELAHELDVILLRQDPPYHMGYLTTTYLLEEIADKVRVLNDPKGVRDAPEKMLITHFSEFMPPTLISGEEGEIRAFGARHKKLVAKRIYGHGGRDVYLFDAGDPALYQMAAEQWQYHAEPLMFQPYLPEIAKGDTRVVMFDGDVMGAMRRFPAAGNFLANLAQGGRAEKTALSPRAREICAALAPVLKKRGLYFVGVDFIDDRLIEINVTSPTGLAAINRLDNLKGDDRLEIQFWKKLG